MPSFGAETMNEYYTFAFVIIVLVTLYQFYSFSTEAYDMFVHPAFNWTCSNVNVIDNKFGEKCDIIRKYVPGEDVYEYDYTNFYPEGQLDYGNQEIVPIDEAVANLRFDQTKNQTSQQLNQIALSGRDRVRESFQKYIEEQNNGMPINRKILRQMAETGEETVGIEQELPIVGMEHEDTTEDSNEDIAEETKVLVEHPDSIEQVSEDAPASDKISEVVIIGAMKCGTSAVNNFLRFHPNAVPTGELYFFIKSYLEGKKEPEDYKEEYLKLMPKARDEDVIYEKTPTYHRIPKVAYRIKEMNPDMKIIFIVCDNSRRALSRYFHLENMIKNVGKTSEKLMKKFDQAGGNYEEFDKKIGETADKMYSLMEQIVEESENSKAIGDDAFIEEVYQRYMHRRDPFTQEYLGFTENVLADGLYVLYMRQYIEVFGEDKVLLIDGNELYTSPGPIMLEIQKFMGLEQVIQPKDFVFNEDRGMFCLMRPGEDSCSKLPQTKGRSIHRHLSVEASSKLEKFFKPFDEYLAEMMSRDHFKWLYGQDSDAQS